MKKSENDKTLSKSQMLRLLNARQKAIEKLKLIKQLKNQKDLE